MSLLGIGTSLGSSLFSSATAELQMQTQSPATQRQSGASQLSNDTVSLSPRGQFIGSLQALQASDPQKFKQILTQAAGELQTEAGKAGNTARAQSLSGLARKFQDVANTGDVSQLKPATYSNRVQQAYGAQQPDGVQELLNSFGRGQSAGSSPQASALSAVTNGLSTSSLATGTQYVSKSITAI
jgi:ABC-type transporter Mla subunit MlaD